jgi:hypothetical protein
VVNDPTPDFQYADWADLLGRNDASDNLGAEWQSVADIAAATGAALENIRATLASAKRDGRLEMTRVYRESIDGAMRLIPVYRVRAQ